VKWLVQAQIDQRRGGAIDSHAGDLDDNHVAWIAWGPYPWADGTNVRSDGLTWSRSEFQSDGTHPATAAQQKVGAMLLAFLKSEPTAMPWFLASPPNTHKRRAVRP
jgi:lysophospholipase L1-like esterase